MEWAPRRSRLVFSPGAEGEINAQANELALLLLTNTLVVVVVVVVDVVVVAQYTDNMNGGSFLT